MKLSVREQGFLVWEFYKRRLNAYEKKALHDILDGISGLHDKEIPLTDEVIKEILSEKQVAFIKKLGRKFRITNNKEVLMGRPKGSENKPKEV